tara:strand:- start:237 stop:1304 length:1068 start_codon:yes stop_codon:yes gene_type:complete
MSKLNINDVLKQNNLHDEDLKELDKIDEIYYFSNNTITESKDNRLILKKRDHIFFRYEVKDVLGKGAFSNVYKCYDYKHNKEVALKIIRNEKRFHKQADKAEIPALLKINKEITPYLLTIFKIFDYRNHVCISFELLEHDLYKELSNNNFKGFSADKVLKYAGDILRGLEVLRKLKIIHCDLKPENIMLTKNDSLKIIDLGSCYIVNNKMLSNTYIQSRYYRAPEVVMGCNYNYGIDIWSFGCIIYELLTGTPLFKCRGTSDLMGQIVSFLGIPPNKMIEYSTKGLNFFIKIDSDSYSLTNKYNKYGGLYEPKSTCLRELFTEENEKIQKMIDIIITWNYENRPSPTFLINYFDL